MAAIPSEMACGFSEADSAALRALCAGVANEGQQKHAFRWITEVAAMSRVLPHKPGDTHASAFMSGRAFVAHMINRAIEAPTRSKNA